MKAKATHLAAMSADRRATLRQQWSTLVEDVNAALDEDPNGPTGQRLLDRWQSLFQALTGAGPGTETGTGASESMIRAAELQEEVWARRAEWMPADAVRNSGDMPASEAIARIRERMSMFTNADVLKFIERARAARARA